ncbi:TetR/AcrR family transcriptional regulator [Rubellimicrobium rubrum]|uniref:TetR/AcrR family transcriptional regulator n=1 Tax=Rubellimicrobium rubrum TaxID=2585369 RepID=A0A5C4MX15_9RHOB|nr:TetR/AcrR family transcriptional regulator [Rubellimicrobium rubrum]TNC48620.1 TetR/AcrR family transcriptional regulator [Rubellimicrobium rubrum]
MWLDAAYRALIDGGVEAVKILPLASELKISRTSFYWFFKDREELLSALADRWAGRNTGNLIAAAQAYADTEAEAMLNVIGCFLDPQAFDTRFEFAVRSWALQSSVMTERVGAADRDRIAALTAMLERWGHAPLDADVRSRTIYLVQIGYISMQSQETLAERMRRIPTYVEIYTGRKPEAGELARFHARHGYIPDAERTA